MGGGDLPEVVWSSGQFANEMPLCTQFVLNFRLEGNASTAVLGQVVLDTHKHPPGSCDSGSCDNRGGSP